MNGNLADNAVPVYAGDAVTAGSSIDNNSSRIDMAGYDGVLFIATITDSVATGVATLTVEENDADSDAGMTALTGGSATVTSQANDDLNGTTLVVDVYKPEKRYVQAVRTSETANIAFGNVIAIPYSGRKLPLTADDTNSATAKVVSA